MLGLKLGGVAREATIGSLHVMVVCDRIYTQ